MADGIAKLKLIFEFDAIRARFSDRMHPILQVWDEIREEYINIYPLSDTPCDLTRPGEGFVRFYIELRKDDIQEKEK